MALFRASGDELQFAAGRFLIMMLGSTMMVKVSWDRFSNLSVDKEEVDEEERTGQVGKPVPPKASTMVRISTCCLFVVAIVLGSNAWGQTSATGTTATGTPGLSSGSSSSSFGSSAFGNPNFGSTSTTLSAQDFGGSGSGNLLRGALSQQGLVAATTTNAPDHGDGGHGRVWSHGDAGDARE